MRIGKVIVGATAGFLGGAKIGSDIAHYVLLLDPTGIASVSTIGVSAIIGGIGGAFGGDAAGGGK